LGTEAKAVEAEKKAAESVTAKDAALLAKAKAKRNEFRAKISEEWLTKYERVMKFRGSGLAEIRDGQCTACRVKLRPQVFAEVKAGTKMMACDSCQRIIYYNVANDTPVEQIKAAVAAKQKRRGKSLQDRTWVYRKLPETEEELFIALFSDSSNTRRRVYDAVTGRKLGITERRDGDFKVSCLDDLDAGVRLYLTFDEELLESWGSELPTSYMNDLHADLAAALGK
jgi:RNase P subunit RPR2